MLITSCLTEGKVFNLRSTAVKWGWCNSIYLLELRKLDNIKFWHSSRTGSEHFEYLLLMATTGKGLAYRQTNC